MTLQNLLKIQRLHQHQADVRAARKLLAAARRNLADAGVTAIGAGNRFDAAYKCVLQCAMLGLWAQGFRTSTSRPGHHQTAIQSLPLTLGVATSTMVVLDGLRKQRNLSDYEGDEVSTAVLLASIEEAAKLLESTEQWLGVNRPEWLGTD